MLIQVRDISLSEVNGCIKWYNTLSRSYDELYGEEQKVKYGKIIKHLSRGLNSVLDVGCGTGSLLEYLIDSGYSVLRYICIDVSDKLVEIASSRFRDDKYKNTFTDLVVADLTFPPIRSELKLDLVAMITVLKESYNISNIVSKYLSVVGENGFLVYTVIKKVKDGSRSDELRYEDAYIVGKSGKFMEIEARDS
ncbi:MAG: class I SAM-dependent methyltransferase [Sulfolobales archaeon]|nr:class I SAM-dependent methyltransferase [Sulfolobales archaeon]MCX8186248.1 class I SAM-dependent methyltransferase [Sulfolobales archaeon]MDW7969016.1 class I SAM-dependent methyltransferase [Sulfolobales archaeon]